MPQFTSQKGEKKAKVTIMSKLHAYFQTMSKTIARFQKYWNKIIRGVTFTKYPLIASDMPKMTKLTS